MRRFSCWFIALILILSGIPALSETYETIQTGAKGDDVIKLQTRLTELGFFTGEIDGAYGKKTAAAVKAFHALLLQRDGQSASKASGNAITAEELELLYTDPFSFYIADLAVGSNGSEVKALQEKLLKLNYLEGTADGYFGEITKAAIEWFQQLNSLPVTGIADKATQDLLANTQEEADRPAYREIKLGDSGASVKAVQRRLIELGFLMAPETGSYGKSTVTALARFQEYLAALDENYLVEDAETAGIDLQKKLDSDLVLAEEALSRGSKNTTTVARLQRRLNALGYLGRKTIDGKYGSGTASAISSFQANNGLDETGEADLITQRLLYSADAVGFMTPYHLKVSLDDQRVYVYQLQDDNTYELINTYICSTGLGDSTPRGVFTTTTGPGKRWHYFKEFVCWAQYAYYIEGDIMFHSILFDQKDESTLRYGSKAALGQKASHGCVRLKVEDAEWIYKNCAKGTLVTIY